MNSDDITDIGQAGILVLLGTLLSMFSGFLFRLIGARFLTADQFGLVVLGITIVNIASIPCILGLNQGIVKFLSDKDNTHNRNSYITVSLLTTLIAGLFVAFLGIAVNDIIQKFLFEGMNSNSFLYIILLTIPVFALFQLLSGILRGAMDSRGFVNISKVCKPATQLGFTGLAIYLFGTSVSVAGAFFASIFISVSFGLYLVWNHGWRPEIDRSLQYSTLFQFSLPLLISSSVFILLSHVDKLLIGYYINSSGVAIYEVTVTIASLLGLFRSSFGFLLYPKLSEKLSMGKESAIRNMYTQTTKWIILLSTPAFAILVTRPHILVELFGSQYDVNDVRLPLVLLSSGLFLNAIVGPNGEALLGFGHSKKVLFYNLVSVFINIILNIILIPRFGLNGAAAASLIGYTVMNFGKSIDLYINHAIPVLSIKPVITSLLTFVLCIFLVYLLPATSLMIEFALLSSVGFLSLVAGVGVLWIVGGLSEADRELIPKI
ncbi:putative flippase AglR [Halalkalicoccus paucihalophilus]|uniref:Putative flippase AglR n=1 Tax=Halalkalicoccus paucihalophilus TaxID=1008153 RepID=A0A151AB16_9EURY|nr:oligosaccharide flippase family protein [Halalkalicoccus paucihalophilus]KYH24896.1 putative flippase AglR [Halalkalicoccus paucihalophilus]